MKVTVLFKLQWQLAHNIMIPVHNRAQTSKHYHNPISRSKLSKVYFMDAKNKTAKAGKRCFSKTKYL